MVEWGRLLSGYWGEILSRRFESCPPRHFNNAPEQGALLHADRLATGSISPLHSRPPDAPGVHKLAIF